MSVSSTNRILLLLDHEENCRLLANALAGRYNLLVNERGEEALYKTFDLCIIDGTALDRLWQQVRDRKRAVIPYFLPFLLVTSRQDVGMATRHLWKTVDEVIISPIERIELLARVESLLLARRLSLEANRAVVQTAPNLVIVLDRQGIVQQWNPAAERMLGWSAAEVLGKPLPAIPAGQKGAFDALFARVLEGEVAVHCETQCQRKDGTLLDMIVSASPLRDVDGSPSMVVMIGVDVTDRKRAERLMAQRLAEHEALHRLSIALRNAQTVAMALPVLLDETLAALDIEAGAIWVYHSREDVLRVEAARGWCKELDKQPIQPGEGLCGEVFVSGQSHISVEFAYDPSISASEREKLPPGWGGACIPIRGDTRNHGVLFVAVRLPRQITGEEARLLETLAEMAGITLQRMELNEQFIHLQRMEAVGRLAGGVAHDFNNMLTVILGHVQFAMDKVDPGSPIYSNLQEIHKAAERSAALTRQLLAFARKQVAKPQVLNLNETVAGMAKMLQRLVGEDIQLVWRPGADLWLVNIDPTQIDQILANLCVNARDAIEGVGQVIIETQNATLDAAYCAAHAGFVPGDYVMLSVSDSGRGMTKEVMDHLFEPFFTTKEPGKGTGLGLATVYGIVKQNGGFINVYSEPGKGSTFQIFLPRFVGEAQAPPEAATESPRGHGEIILLVEDELAILEMGKRMLQLLGYTVLAAATPGEALRIATTYEGEIHLLITDAVMPEMNGRELIEQCRQIRPDMKHLLTSGYPADVLAGHGMSEAGFHFVQKPFTLQSLARQVRQALERED